MGLEAACNTIRDAAAVILNTSGIAAKGQVGLGWPLATEIVKILAQAPEQCLISVFPLKNTTRNVTESGPEPMAYVAAAPTLTATVLNNTITLAGAVVANVNLHAFINAPAYPDALYSTVGGDTLASSATALAAAITALAVPGVTASATGAVVTVTGAKTLQVTVGGRTTLSTEVGLYETLVQLSLWTQDDATRSALQDALLGNMGAVDTRWFPVGDGTFINLDFARENWSDESQSAYSLYVGHLVFACTYPMLRTATATQIGAGVAAITTTPSLTQTYATGG